MDVHNIALVFRERIGKATDDTRRTSVTLSTSGPFSPRGGRVETLSRLLTTDVQVLREGTVY